MVELTQAVIIDSNVNKRVNRGVLLHLLDNYYFGEEVTKAVMQACNGISRDKFNSVDKVEVFESLAEFSFFHNARPKGRYGQCGFRTHKHGSYVEVHPALYTHDGHQQYNDTLLHEIAHALEYVWYGNGGHGHTWVAIMRWMGLRPNRCKAGAFLSNNAAQMSKWTYECADCGHKWFVNRKLKRVEYRHHGTCSHKPNRGSLLETQNR